MALEIPDTPARALPRHLVNGMAHPVTPVRDILASRAASIKAGESRGKMRSRREQLEDVIAFFHVIEELKRSRRTGWVNHKIEPCESIADHMYRMAVMTLLQDDERLDTGRCTMIAVVHDMAESIVGDITPLDPIGPEQKHRLELKAIHDLCDLIRGAYPRQADLILDLYDDYENGRSAEARFVKDIDKFELCVQAVEYERRFGVRELQSFFDTSVPRIKSEQVRAWNATLTDERKELWTERGWTGYRDASMPPPSMAIVEPSTSGTNAAISATPHHPSLGSRPLRERVKSHMDAMDQAIAAQDASTAERREIVTARQPPLRPS